VSRKTMGVLEVNEKRYVRGRSLKKDKPSLGSSTHEGRRKEAGTRDDRQSLGVVVRRG